MHGEQLHAEGRERARHLLTTTLRLVQIRRDGVVGHARRSGELHFGVHHNRHRLAVEHRGPGQQLHGVAPWHDIRARGSTAAAKATTTYATATCALSGCALILRQIAGRGNRAWHARHRRCAAATSTPTTTGSATCSAAGTTHRARVGRDRLNPHVPAHGLNARDVAIRRHGQRAHHLARGANAHAESGHGLVDLELDHGIGRRILADEILVSPELGVAFVLALEL